jgi:hypothetical protein
MQRITRPIRRFFRGDALGSPKHLGPKSLKDEVNRVYRAVYVATGDKTEAWNQTLVQFAGPYSSDANDVAYRKQVVQALHQAGGKSHRALRLKRPGGERLLTYRVHPLDVWGNAKDGFQVNDVYPSRGEVQFPEDASHEEIVAALKKAGFIDRNIRHKSIRIDGEQGDTLYVEHESTGRPEYELRPD